MCKMPALRAASLTDWKSGRQVSVQNWDAPDDFAFRAYQSTREK
jgi:hypothetical protein